MVTNQEFLAALRAPSDALETIPKDAVNWICAYPGNNQQWQGRAHTGEGEIELPDQNTFFSVSMYRPINGQIARKRENFVAMLCLVLDDIGTKAKTPPLEPSWKIQTSPGNAQWGYILSPAILDSGIARQLQDAVVAAGYSDPGAKSPETRYMRLPVGSNGKPHHVASNDGKPVSHVVLDWQPGRYFTLEEILAGLGLSLIDKTKGPAKKESHKRHELLNGELIKEAHSDSELIRQIISGESYHDASLVLTARYQSRGMTSRAIIEVVRGIMCSSEDRSSRWHDRFADIPRLVLGAQKFRADNPIAEEIEYINFSSLAATSPSPRKWIAKEWIPRGAVTALYGSGGIGKSLFAQQLAVSIAARCSCLGLETIQGKVLGFFCEDDSDELLRRAERIFADNFLKAEEVNENLYLDARAGKLNTLVTFDSNRNAINTEFMNNLRAQCEKIRPDLVIFDNIAQMFGGLENDRYQVTYFCNLLTGIAREFDCAVLLLGHPAKHTESEFSGSTAWEAAVRSRIFMQRQDDSRLLIRKAKANYSALDGFFAEFRNGLLVPSTGEFTPEIVEKAKTIILQYVERQNAHQEACSHLETARNYVIRKIIAAGLKQELTKGILQRGLKALLDEQKLIPNAVLPWKNSSRHSVHGLKITECTGTLNDADDGASACDFA